MTAGPHGGHCGTSAPARPGRRAKIVLYNPRAGFFTMPLALMGIGSEIVGRLAEGRTLEGCHGCTVRLRDGTIIENPPRPLAPVDRFRAHDYGLIPVERYFKLKGKRQLDYISSQGCNFRCAFCSDPF